MYFILNVIKVQQLIISVALLSDCLRNEQQSDFTINRNTISIMKCVFHPLAVYWD